MNTNVDYKHPAYNEFLPEWDMIGDCVDGERVVKSKKRNTSLIQQIKKTLMIKITNVISVIYLEHLSLMLLEGHLAVYLVLRLVSQ